MLCLDLFTLMMQEKDWSTFLSDGLHLSQKGNKFLFRHLSDLIASSIPDSHSEALRMYFPYHGNIQENDLSSIKP